MAKMVKRIIQQESRIRLVLAADRKVAHLTPTWQDMEVLKSIDSALSPLSFLTDILSGETYVTVSAVIPMLQLIKTNLLKQEDDTQLTKDIKERVITDLESRYSVQGDVMEILQLATFLDTRFKSKPFNDAETDYLKMVITDQCDDDSSPVSTQSADSKNPAVEPPAKKPKTLGTFFKEHDGDNVQQSLSSSESLPLTELCKKELENYLCSPNLDFEKDPLAWWRSVSVKYPHLSHVARKYLCVCATSSPSEQVFSCSGNIVTPLRASMNPSKVDMFTFLSKNLD